MHWALSIKQWLKHQVSALQLGQDSGPMLLGLTFSPQSHFIFKHWHIWLRCFHSSNLSLKASVVQRQAVQDSCSSLAPAAQTWPFCLYLPVRKWGPSSSFLWSQSCQATASPLDFMVIFQPWQEKRHTKGITFISRVKVSQKVSSHWKHAIYHPNYKEVWMASIFNCYIGSLIIIRILLVTKEKKKSHV